VARPISIHHPGYALSDIQLRQAGLKVVQSNQYVLEFDGWASARRAMEVRWGRTSLRGQLTRSQPLHSSRQSSIFPTLCHGEHHRLNARLMFNLGAALGDVYLDNVSLWMVAPADFNRDRMSGSVICRCLRGNGCARAQGSPRI